MDAFLQVMLARQNGFKCKDDGSAMLWSFLGFFVPVDVLILSGYFMASVNAVQKLRITETAKIWTISVI